MAMVDVKRAGLATSPSPVIWADCPIKRYTYNPGDGIHIWEDFTGGFVDDASPDGKWLLVGTNPDLNKVADEEFGVVELEGSAGDNDDSYLCSNPLYELKMNSGKRVWFEVRAKVEDEDDDHAIFAGLVESVAMATGLIADDGAGPVDEDLIGFLAVTDATNMGDIKSVYQQGGDAAVTVVDSDSHSPVDDAYFKLGMKFDGAKTVTFYADGVAVGTLDVDDLANNKMANILGIAVGIKNCKAAAEFLSVDWIRFACDKYALGY